MEATQRPPKQWCLTKTETITSFEKWHQNLVYILSLDAQFAQFLLDGATWLKNSKNRPLRGFSNDGSSVSEGSHRTAQQKVSMLELMLGVIANYCPVISRNTTVKTSTSMGSIWSAICLHFSFEATRAHFLDLSEIQLEHGKRPEDLYQRLMAFTEDNLLHSNSIQDHGALLTEDEELTPTSENFIVFTWLRLVHPDLPKLVKQRYGTELHSCTLASIKPEISQALQSLLDEIRATEDAKVMRTTASYCTPAQAAKPTTRF